MMITLSLLIVGLCLFLHRKLKSTTGSVSLHTLPWSEENLEVFTLSGQEEITGIYLPPTPSPPPAYESVVKVNIRDNLEMLKKCSSSPDNTKTKKTIRCSDDELPSYEAAIKLKGDDYI
ncbi:hypothetical protein Phum_PHUM377880 [Pediculus humanus corporis]|uniref:Uncharacterized protein n=1 Tax=Pediculus humanus subsp. corporis TaxID=121224 RepID=E0VQH8_PEDHC|nr:uncharacterized protein Phum_PHUM377880 [Pediculus humanus corporis]EEB15634.1 hypothetical protein Phum_PHUM377880 [Pediculus humanus corporis]